MKKIVNRLLGIGLSMALLLISAGCSPENSAGSSPKNEACDKPVIYLYPTQTEQVNVKLNFSGKLNCTYPQYSANGWSVTAHPDGTLTGSGGKQYSYLYWEGTGDIQPDFSSGFVVKGSDTAAFLQEKLASLGLTPREYNEFIVYWLPKMQDNTYNLISFQGTNYTDAAKLTVTPKPDSILRVYMAYKSLKAVVTVPKQTLPSFARKGFTVVEWGGMEVSD